MVLEELGLDKLRESEHLHFQFVSTGFTLKTSNGLYLGLTRKYRV